MPRIYTLPEGFEISPDPSDKRIKCVTCFEISPARAWIQRDSAKKHIESRYHQEAQADLASRNQNRAARAAANAVAATQLFAGPALNNLPANAFSHLPPLSHLQPRPGESTAWEEFFASDDFSAGVDTELAGTKQQERVLQELRNLGAWDDDTAVDEFDISSELEHLALEDLEDEDLLYELNRKLYVSPLDVEAELGIEIQPDEVRDWYPYPNKTILVLDLIDNLPRQRISNTLMKIILWAMKKAGARNVPSLDGLRKVQNTLRGAAPKVRADEEPNKPADEVYDLSMTPEDKSQLLKSLDCSPGIRSFLWRSAFGNLFYVNDIRRLVARDFSNPLLRPHIHVYPEISNDGFIREFWHAEKWLETVDYQNLTPMWDSGFKKYYVDELASLEDSTYVIPIRWIIVRQEMHVDCYVVVVDNELNAHVDTLSMKRFAAKSLDKNYLDLQNSMLTWARESSQFTDRMPHPLWKLAKGRPVYTSFIDLFCDDVSGNRSKSWNKHNNVYFIHKNLPQKFLQQESNTHFVTTSTVASPCEQMEAVNMVIESTHELLVETYDCVHKCDALLRIFVNAEDADNPMGSELCSHIGKGGNKFCRKCHVGGTQEYKRSDEGFHSLFSPGTPRTSAETLADLQKQAEIAVTGVEARVTELQTASGTKCKYTQVWIDDLIKRARAMKLNGDKSPDEVSFELHAWVKENADRLFNPFLRIPGVDINKDTPVEILHTILLGLVKYAWASIKWTKENKAKYASRLSAVDISGLSIPPIRAGYIMQYAKSLIGRQLKQVTQTSLFCMYDFLPESLFNIWRAISELTPLVWYTEIESMGDHNKLVEQAADNVLDAFAVFDPTIIIQKHKAHLLVHMTEDIVRQGPLVGVATEVFECYNTVFRACSIFSNHLAPSRDISRQLAGQEDVRHRLFGGHWKTSDGQVVQAGSKVRDLIFSEPLLQGVLGWTDHTAVTPGRVKLAPIPRADRGQRKSLLLQDGPGSMALNHHQYAQVSGWHRCSWVISQSGDVCSLGSWIFSTSPVTSKVIAGKILDILQSIPGPGLANTNLSPVVNMEQFEVLETLHERFHMPIMRRRFQEEEVLIVPASNVMFDFNAQHDCYTGKCGETGLRKKTLERMEIETLESFIEHRVDATPRFIINTSGFHNAARLRRVLNKGLWTPKPFWAPQEREEKHSELAARVRAADTLKKASKKRKAVEEVEEPESETDLQPRPQKRARTEDF